MSGYEIYDDFIAPNGTLMQFRVCPTGQIWRATGAGGSVAAINNNLYSSTANTYSYLPFGSPVKRVAGDFSFLPVPAGLGDISDAGIAIIADAFTGGDVLNTMLHMQMDTTGWSLSKRVAGGSFIGLAARAMTLLTDGTVYSVAMEIAAGSVSITMPDGWTQTINDSAIGTAIVPTYGLWQIAGASTSYFKRWHTINMGARHITANTGNVPLPVNCIMEGNVPLRAIPAELAKRFYGD